MLLSACRAHAVAQPGVTNGDTFGNGLVVSTLCEVDTSWNVEQCWFFVQPVCRNSENADLCFFFYLQH